MTERRRIVSRGYDQMAERYAAWSDDPALRLEWLVHVTAPLPPGASVLELGSGSGLPVARALLDAQFAYRGIDSSRTMIELARRNVPDGRFELADIVELDLPPESVHAVVSFYTLTHIPREEHAGLLERIGRWLRPGGIFAATMGAGDSGDWTGEWLGVEMFFSHFDAETNLELVRAAGFEIVESMAREETGSDAGASFLWVVARRGEKR